MPKGKIRIRRRNDGSLSRFIQISGGKKIGIPHVFLLNESHDRVECEYETGPGGITKIVIDGKEIGVDTEMQEERKKRQEENKKRKDRELQEKRKESIAGRQDGHHAGRQRGPQLDFDLSERSKLPRDTRSILIGQEPYIENLALRIQKGANFWEENKGKATLYQEKKGSRRQGTQDRLMKHLPNDDFDYGAFPFPEFTSNIFTSTVKLLGETNLKRGFLSTASRLIIGIGSASVFEVGITLHHIYGIPYIPGSALKGVTRSWMILSKFDGEEGKALANKEFCDIFGCPAEWKDNDNKIYKSWYNDKADNGERQGNIIFFDAFPTKPPTIEEDVMNVHYEKYYQGKMPPTDTQTPIPISFLAVAANTTFQFILGVQAKGDNLDKSILLSDVSEQLQSALTQHGIGAKTAVGYGYFNPA